MIKLYKIENLMSLHTKLFQEVKDRKVRKWLAIYTSTALTIIGVLQLFSLRYKLPSYLFDIPLIFLVFGLFSTIVLAWNHGKEDKQKVKLSEIIIHSTFFVGALVVIALYILFPSNPKVEISIGSRSIAVLPFQNMSDSKEDEYFSDGVTEDILTHLSKISGLKVISRTSVMKYKNQDKNIREIGKELGVETILEGSVRRSGNRVRIVAQLINAYSDIHIWAETYDRELKDIFSIQSEIAEKIAAALQTNLLPLEKKLIKTNSTINTDAYAFYLKGRQNYYNYNNEDNDRAINMFKKALNIDSNYALALAGLADAYNQRVLKYGYSEDWYDSALVFSKKSLSINPNLSEGYKAVALTYDNLGEKELASFNYEKAIKLNPNFVSAMLNYGQIKLSSGKLDEALFWLRRANLLEPDNIWVMISSGIVYKILGCNSLAIQWGKKAVAMDSENAFALLMLGEFYLNAENFNEAKKYIDQSLAMNNKFTVAWYISGQLEAVKGNYELAKKDIDSLIKLTDTKNPEYYYAHTLLKLNKKDEAMKILAAQKKEYIESLAEHPMASSSMDYISLAEIYAILNEKENAFKLWEEAINKGWRDMKRITLFPYFENLREEPKYHQLLNVMQTKINSLKSVIKEKYPEYKICN
ncbi:MAG: tetratricopeptide repeat protein [Ignavibacteriota bacterium]